MRFHYPEWKKVNSAEKIFYTGGSTMSNCLTYVNRFFDSLEMYEDVARGHSYKSYNREAVRAFLENETKENAYEVYRTFFDSYRIAIEGDSNPFLDIVDILHSYEQTAATLIDKQRDHFIHSVNVFVTGLCVFAQSAEYRDAFNSAVPEKEYADAYKTENEEFYYRWGIASLLHDIGYPVEIVGNQINKFVKFVTEADGSDKKVRAKISYENFEEINSIREIKDRAKFAKKYCMAYGIGDYTDVLNPHALMADRIHTTLNADRDEVRNFLDGYVRKMAESGFIDHGYYSAMIVLKWYGFLIQQCSYNPVYFYFPVLDSATAILLHNIFRNVLQKPPFCLAAMNAGDNPIAFLLILCDELQEWNREAKGIITRTFTLSETVNLEIRDGYFSATYITRKGYLPENFCAEKKELIESMLNVGDLFPLGFSIDNESLESLAPMKEGFHGMVPRPLMENAELLAIAIHNKYNEKRLRENPGIEVTEFSKLSDDLKYSNLRQARGIYEKLESVGLCLRRKGEKGELSKIPEDYIEALAEYEHDAWVNERIAQGWTLGEKDIEKKTTPYLVPYSELSEEIKDYDRDAVRNIPELAYMIGMAVYEAR